MAALMYEMAATDPYEILCLSFDDIERLDKEGKSKTSDEKIKMSYYKLYITHHSDKNRSGVDSKASMKVREDLDRAKLQIGSYIDRQNYNNSPEGLNGFRENSQAQPDSGKPTEVHDRQNYNNSTEGLNGFRGKSQAQPDSGKPTEVHDRQNYNNSRMRGQSQARPDSGKPTEVHDRQNYNNSAEGPNGFRGKFQAQPHSGKPTEVHDRQNYNSSRMRGQSQAQPDPGKPTEVQKSIICPFFFAGKCTFGDNCKFSHSRSNALVPTKQPNKPAKTDSDGASSQLVSTKNKSADAPAESIAPVAAMFAALLKVISVVDVPNKDSAVTRAARLPCRYFADNKCKLGDKCAYLHEATGGAQKGIGGQSDDSDKKTNMHCSFFAANKCMADNCPFLHDSSRLSSSDLHQLSRGPSKNEKPRGPRKKVTATSKSTRFEWNNLPRESHKKIIIIGGTGHGKSAFVNSIHNYFKKTTLRTVEVVIPTSHITRTVGANIHTEARGSTADSQTQECTHYVFQDPENPEKRSITFIDTPGLGDTRGAETDEHNITLVLKAAQEAEASNTLSGIILVMKGTENRSTLNMKAVYTMLKAGMPDAILNNILVVFSYCAHPDECQATKLIPFETPSESIFYYNNLSFVADLQKIYKESETNEKARDYLDTIEQSWDRTMEEITEILKVAFTQNFTPMASFKNLFNQRMKVY